MSSLRVYTDGACSRNSGAGGWAYIIDNGHKSIERFGPSKSPTTNNRMELAAILGALMEIPSGVSVIVYTDSEYARGCLTVWWRYWVRNNWQTKEEKPVVNKDIILRILDQVSRIGHVEFIHVKRNSTPRMIQVDSLAKQGKEQFLKKEPVANV